MLPRSHLDSRLALQLTSDIFRVAGPGRTTGFIGEDPRVAALGHVRALAGITIERGKSDLDGRDPSGRGCPTYGNETPVSLIDGGYFDNSGLESALELANWLELKEKVKPIVVAVTGDGDSSVPPDKVVRCGAETTDPRALRPQKHVWEPIGPVLGLYDVRSGHVDVLQRRAAEQLCGEGRFFQFYLPAWGKMAVPLNWVLSEDRADFIWAAVVGKNRGVPDRQLTKEEKDILAAHLVRNRCEMYRLETRLRNAAPRLEEEGECNTSPPKY